MSVTLDNRGGGCCFIVTDKSPWLYCGKPVERRRSDGLWHYCDKCKAVMSAGASRYHPRDVSRVERTALHASR